MGEKLFIGVGVRDAKGLPLLPGVHNSVRWLSEWADSAGYAIVTVTDENNTKVDVTRIAGEVSKKLEPGHRRILLYFAGHGFSVPPDQYLILSAGYDVPRERITRNGFRDMLATYAPDQISVITDACRVMKPFRGLADSVIDPLEGEVTNLQTFDGFYAAQDGAQAFAFKANAGDPEMCVFSWVLHRGLTFESLEACDQTISTPARDVVTSGSLAKYLFRTVPVEAAARDVWQKPDVSAGFIRPDDIYSERARSGIHTEGFRDGGDNPFPFDAGTKSVRGIDAEATPPLEARISSEWRKPFMDWAYQRISSNSDSPWLILNTIGTPKIVSPVTNPLLETHATQSFVHGAAPQKAYDACAVTRRSLWTPASSAKSQTVLVSAGEASALVPVHRDLWTALQLDGTPNGAGLEAMGWGSPHYGPNKYASLSPLEVLKGLLRGTISGADAARIATSIRSAKHDDPLMGIVAAYLYDGIGDVENTRRMCYYYLYNNQDVPFDIALLARAPIEVFNGQFVVHAPATNAIASDGPSFIRDATPACIVPIAGLAPLLRAGWAQLHRTGQAWHQKLLAFTDDLTESPLATFEGERARTGISALLRTPL